MSKAKQSDKYAGQVCIDAKNSHFQDVHITIQQVSSVQQVGHWQHDSTHNDVYIQHDDGKKYQVFGLSTQQSDEIAQLFKQRGGKLSRMTYE